MQRYFVASDAFVDDLVIIDGADAHHIVRVMRMKEGDTVIVSDGETKTAMAQIRSLDSKQVQLSIVEYLPQEAEASWHVTIAQGLPKGDKMELIVQKCTEIGAAAFLPFESERVIVQYDHKKEAKRLERWSKIAKEAAEQAHRNRIPRIYETCSFKQLLDRFDQYQLVLFCYEKTGASQSGLGLKDVLKAFHAELADKQASPNILVIAGPEGGFSEQEAQRAEQAGAKLVGLGKRILRAETAGLVALTSIMYESGEMGGA